MTYLLPFLYCLDWLFSYFLSICYLTFSLMFSNFSGLMTIVHYLGKDSIKDSEFFIKYFILVSGKFIFHLVIFLFFPSYLNSFACPFAQGDS